MLTFFVTYHVNSKDISPEEANNLNINNKIIIIDVRNKSEWKETGIIPGSNLVQMLNPIFKIRKNFVEEMMEILGEDKRIYAAIICKSGGRSSAAVSILKDKGYINIFNIAEGILGHTENTGWLSKKLPIEKCGQKCD